MSAAAAASSVDFAESLQEAPVASTEGWQLRRRAHREGDGMAVRKVAYVDIKVPRRAGEGAKVLRALKDAGVNLLAFTGFPDRGGKAQIDIVTDDLAGVRRVARSEGWRPSPVKKGLLVQGNDEVGAVYRQLRKLADARIRVTAVDAVAAGKGRYGMILWVKPRDHARAARALGAR